MFNLVASLQRSEAFQRGATPKPEFDCALGHLSTDLRASRLSDPRAPQDQDVST